MFIRSCFLALAALAAKAGLAAPLDDPKVLQPTPREISAPDAPDAAGRAVEGGPGGLGNWPDWTEPQAAFEAGEMARCIELLRQAVALRPSLPPPQVTLARFHMAAGDYPLARAALEAAAADDPQQPDLYLAFGQLAMRESRHSDALLHFERAASLKAPANWPRERAEEVAALALAGQAAVAEHRGHWEGAQSLLKRLVEMNPQAASLRDRWAQALFRSGRASKAFEEFDIAYRQDRSVNPPEISMAVQHVRGGNFFEAEAWYRRALEKYPENPKVYFEHSVALVFQARPAEAEGQAARAAALGLKSAELDLHRARIAYQQQDHEGALALLEAAVVEYPEHLGIRDLLALVLSESGDQGQRRRALELAETNARQDADSPRAQAMLGWVLTCNGRQEEGQRLLRSAVSQSSDPQVLYFAAQVLRRGGHSQESSQLAARLQRELPKPSMFLQREQARAWLAKLAEGGAEQPADDGRGAP